MRVCSPHPTPHCTSIVDHTGIEVSIAPHGTGSCKEIGKVLIYFIVLFYGIFSLWNFMASEFLFTLSTVTKLTTFSTGNSKVMRPV